MVALLVWVLFGWRLLVALWHGGGYARRCALLARRLLRLLVMAQAMLLYELPCAGLATVVGVSMFVY